MALEEKLTTSQLDFDKDRFRLDLDYRRRVLKQEKELETERLDFDKDKFRLDLDYRRCVLKQEKELEDAAARLRQGSLPSRPGLPPPHDEAGGGAGDAAARSWSAEENEFRRKHSTIAGSARMWTTGTKLLRSRVKSRTGATTLNWNGSASTERPVLTQQSWESMRAHQGMLWQTYQARLTSIDNNPDMSPEARAAARTAAGADYAAASQDGALIGDPNLIDYGEHGDND